MMRYLLSITMILTFGLVGTAQITTSADTVNLAFGEYIDYGEFTINNESNQRRTLRVGIEQLCVGDTPACMQICFGALCLNCTSESMDWATLDLLELGPFESSTADFKIVDFDNVMEGSSWRVYFYDGAEPSVTKDLIVNIDACESSNTSGNGIITTDADTVKLGFGEYVDYNTFTITNNSNARRTLGIGVERLCKGANTAPAVEICFGAQCFLPVDSAIVWNLDLVDLGPFGETQEFKFTETNMVDEGSTWKVTFYDRNDDSVFKDVIFEVDQCGTVSTNEKFQTLKELRVFPNPATDLINLELSQSNISDLHFTLYDNTGRIVKQVNGQKTIMLDDVPQGKYFYKATLGDKVQTSPLIIH